MTNMYRERELGDKAEALLANETWQMAWDAYRQRIFELIEQSADDAMVLELKRRLGVAASVKGQLERIMKDGKVAAASIRVEEERASLANRIRSTFTNVF